MSKYIAKLKYLENVKTNRNLGLSKYYTSAFMFAMDVHIFTQSGS
jgi:hypothetical protein